VKQAFSSSDYCLPVAEQQSQPPPRQQRQTKQKAAASALLTASSVFDDDDDFDDEDGIGISSSSSSYSSNTKAPSSKDNSSSTSSSTKSRSKKKKQEQSLASSSAQASAGGAGSGAAAVDDGRGNYRCGRCGAPKKGHVCQYQPKVKRRADQPEPIMRDFSCQVELDEKCSVRLLNLEMQGTAMSYVSSVCVLQSILERSLLPCVQAC
jgi:hypothetical protein